MNDAKNKEAAANAQKNRSSWILISGKRDLIAVSKLLGPLVALIIVGINFREFVVHSIEANLQINGLIIATILYGTGLIISRFLSAQRDFMLIEYFGDEAKSGRAMHEITEDPWIKQRYIRHYFKHVAAMETGGSSEENRHAIESELHALGDEYNSKMELPQFLVGFMIALGLLGTFIGLLSTLTGISSMLDGIGGASGGAMDAQFIKLVGQLRQPLQGMGIAFSASMFGLIGSLVLSIMMINLRRYIARVLMFARNAMHDIMEMKHIANMHTGGSGGRGSKMVMLGNISTRRFSSGGAGAGRGGPTVAAPTIEQLDEMIRQATSAYSAETESTLMMLAGRVDLLAGRLDTLVGSIEASTARSKHLNELLGFGPRMKEVSELTHDQIKTLVEEHIQYRSEIGRRFNTLIEKLSAIGEAQVASGRHLWEMRETFTKLATAAAAQELQTMTMGQQTMLLEALLSETRQTRQLLTQVLMQGPNEA